MHGGGENYSGREAAEYQQHLSGDAARFGASQEIHRSEAEPRHVDDGTKRKEHAE